MPALRGVGYSLDTAIADLIDNSIAAGARSISITPRFADGAASLAILDDGCGMTPEVMLEALRFGCAGPTAPRRESDLGRFGLGLKTASLSQLRRLTFCSNVGLCTLARQFLWWPCAAWRMARMGSQEPDVQRKLKVSRNAEQTGCMALEGSAVS
jgi:hypothetical protein